MSDSRLNYYDPEFSPDRPQGNGLLILITGNTFSFAVIQLDDNKVLVWGEQYNIVELAMPNELRHILTAKYNSVKIGVQSLGFAIIPTQLFEYEKIAAYSQFVSKDPSDTVLVNKLDADNFVVFKLDLDIAEAISTHFSLDHVFFAGAAWISAVNFARPYNQPLYVNAEGNILQLLYFDDGKLRFYNAFEFNNPDELMYYVVLAANELGLNLDATSVILSGDISLSDRKIHRINDMLPKVYFNQNHVIILPDGFILHQILMLSGLALCELLVVS